MADESQTNQGTQSTTQSSQGQGSQSSSAQSATGDGSASKQGTGGSTQTSQTQGQQSQAATRPDWAPESIWNPTTNSFDNDKAKAFREEHDSLLAFKGAEDTKRLTLPKTPDEYKVELTKEFKPPAGVDFAIDDKNPALASLKAWAHKHAIPQSALSEVVDVYAGTVVGSMAAQKAAYAAEVTKLGPAGPARIDALGMWMKGVLGDKAAVLTGTKGADGKSTNGVLWTAGIVEAFEALQQKFTGGGSHYTGNGRDNGASDGKIPGYAGMSFEQRRQAQEQRRQNGAR